MPLLGRSFWPAAADARFSDLCAKVMVVIVLIYDTVFDGNAPLEIENW
jgi:hypothetical protein